MELGLGLYLVPARTPDLLKVHWTMQESGNRIVVELNIKRDNNIAIAFCGDQHSTMNQWRELIDELDRLDCAAVIDARSITEYVPEIEAYLLALQADEKPCLRLHRMAVVTSDNPLPELNFFIFSVRNLGLQIKSFDCIDAATAWAGGGHALQSAQS